MPGPARLRAILPKQEISALYPPPRIRKWLEEVGKEFQKEMKEYPPPKAGSAYKRTRRYRRGWNRPLQITSFSVTALNEVAYARYVGGPRDRRPGRVGQLRFHRQTGWKSQSDVAPKVIRRNLPRLRKLVLPVRNIPGGIRSL